ncbi:MAG: hypothetical protein AAF399_21285 [Bacteroidota bacterium]
MKHFAVFISWLTFCFITCTICLGQDQLVLRDGATLRGKVTEVNVLEILYTTENSSSIQSIEKAKVARIIYANGYEDVFSVMERTRESTSAPVEPQPQVELPPPPPPEKLTSNLLPDPTSSNPYEEIAPKGGGLALAILVGGSLNMGWDPGNTSWDDHLAKKMAQATSNQLFSVQRRPLPGYQGSVMLGYQSRKGVSLTLGAGYAAQLWETRLREQYQDSEVQYDAFWDSATTVSQAQLYVPLTFRLPMGESFRLNMTIMGVYHLQTENYQREQYFEVVNGDRNDAAAYHEISLQQNYRTPYWYPGAGVGISYLGDSGVLVSLDFLWQGASLMQDTFSYHVFQAQLGVGYSLTP